MKTTLISFLFIFCFPLFSKAQSGIYLTYEDFKKGILVKTDSLKPMKYSWQKNKLEVSINSKMAQYEVETIFGYLDNGHLHRFYINGKRAMSFELYTYGEYYLWVDSAFIDFGSSYYANESTGAHTATQPTGSSMNYHYHEGGSNTLIYHALSKNINDRLYVVGDAEQIGSTENIGAGMKGWKEFEEYKEFKPVSDCVNAKLEKKNQLFDLLVSCLKAVNSYNTDVRKVIPPVVH